MSVQWIAAIIGVGLALTIFTLVRRDRLHGPYALWWLLVAVAALLTGLFPEAVDWLGKLTGVYYPPVLPIIVGLSLVMVRLLKMDIDRSHQERRLRRLVQKLAILEAEMAELRDDNNHRPVNPSDNGES